jgi:hypothetical protein
VFEVEYLVTAAVAALVPRDALPSCSISTRDGQTRAVTRRPGQSGVEYQLVFTLTRPLPSTTSGYRISSIGNLSSASGSRCDRSISLASPTVMFLPLMVRSRLAMQPASSCSFSETRSFASGTGTSQFRR